LELAGAPGVLQNTPGRARIPAGEARVKFIGLLVFLALVPVFHSLLLSGPAGRRLVAFLLGFLPFLLQVAHLVVAPIPWPYWPGYVKGIEFSLIDALALAVVLAPRAGRARAIHAAPFFGMIAVALLSVFHTQVPLAAMFVAWQTFRVFLIYMAATRLASDAAGRRALIAGMVLGLGCNAVWALVQHLRGTYQATGLFVHQNLLGMLAHFVALPAAALYVADKRAKWVLLALVAAGTVAILGASRGTIGLEAAGLALLLIGISVFWPMPRGLALTFAGAIALAALAPVALTVLAPRFASVEHSDYDEREAFTRAAKDMLADHPWGVGANHYVLAANSQGYSDRAKVGWGEGSRAANVHNAYLLTAAEMGYIALVPFVWLSILTALGGLVWCFRSRDKRLSIALFGTCMAQFVVAVHNTVEWIFVTYAAQVLFCINLGTMAGLIGEIRASRRRPAAVDPVVVEPAPASPQMA